MRTLLGLIMATAFALPCAAAERQAISKTSGAEAAKLVLAERYLTLTHRQDLVRVTFTKQLQTSTNFCKDRACKVDLDRAIAKAMDKTSRQYVRSLAELLANRLTESELKAAIGFASSPDGQAITRATDAMTDDLAVLGHAISVNVLADVSQQFCPTHPGICINPSPSVSTKR